MKKRVGVSCGCGWRGRRVWGGNECEHEYGGCDCAWGRCPKCGGHLSETAYLHALHKRQAEADKWWEAEGKFIYGTAS